MGPRFKNADSYLHYNDYIIYDSRRKHKPKKWREEGSFLLKYWKFCRKINNI